jgi:hypothetical protein
MEVERRPQAVGITVGGLRPFKKLLLDPGFMSWSNQFVEFWVADSPG